MRSMTLKTGLKRVGLGAALAMGTALPAMAQDAICGTMGAGGTWIGGAADTSDLNTLTDPFDQMALIMSGGRHVSYFTVSAQTDVRLEAESSDGGDPLVEVYDEAGNFVNSDDDSGGNLSARLETSLAPGTYCMIARTFDGSGTTAYLRLGRDDTPALTAGMNPDTWSDPDSGYTDPWATSGTCEFATAERPFGEAAIDFSAGPVTISAVPNNSPYLGFTLAEPTALTVTAVNPTADPIIAVYDGNNIWLAENDDYDGLNSRIDFMNTLPAGNYCINLRAYNDGSLPVDVALSTYDPAAAMRGMIDRAEASPPLDGSHPVTDLGALPARHRADIQATGAAATWFSFEVTDTGVVAIEAVANGAADPVLVLFDDFGREVAFADDSNGSLDPIMLSRVSPGTYVLALKLYSTDSRALVRMSFESFTPAGR